MAQAGMAQAGMGQAGMAQAGMAEAFQLDRSVPDAGPAPVLDREQRAVVDHRSGHLLVLAGPGTGKTATLAELIAARIRDPEASIPAGRILALTFGRRAARELADRVGQRLGGGPVPAISTFHSFAYATLRQHQDPVAFAAPVRLLTAAEQDARLRELLTHAVGEGRLAWPESLSAAVGTRGMAEHMRELLARARGLGLDGRQLARIGRGARIPVWTAVGRFFEEYLDVLGFEGVLDYAELMHEVVALASKEREGRALREAYRLVVVDEFQDTDPAQVRLLEELARGGAQIIAVGDPDQAIYGFRGADVGGILRFPHRFRDPLTGQEAPIVVLRTNRRCSRPIAQAALRVLGHVPMAGLPAHVQRAHRTPEVADRPAVVEARTYLSMSAQATGVADILLRARAGLSAEAIGWSDMAVLVRTPAVDAPPIARALRSAGIPVEVPADEVALADEPAVRALLSIVGLALDPAAPGISARELLLGPLGRLDAIEVRAIARALHRAQAGPGQAGPGQSGSGQVSVTEGVPPRGAPRQDGPPQDGPKDGPTAAGSAGPPTADQGGGAERRAEAHADDDVPPSDRLLTAALSAGLLPRGVRLPAAARAGFRRVAKAVLAARRVLDRRGMVSEVLWAVWAATDWPERLREAALRSAGGTSPADRDLDAVIAMFDLANRLPAERTGRIGMAAFLSDVEALRLPQSSGLSEDRSSDRVRLLSAHRAKGLEWELVVVAGVQEGQWPDLRLRSDLLRVGELGSRGRIDPPTYAERLAEERRLMYVACSRARSALHVTALAEPSEGGLQPSRFLADLGVPVTAMPMRSALPMTAAGLVAALRAAATEPARVLADGQPDPEAERRRGAAIRRLAALSVALREGRLGGSQGPLAAADPRGWWGLRPLTALTESDPPSAVPGGAAGVRLSPSAVESLRTCPLRWFLDRRVGAGSPAGGAAAVGRVVHAVAEALGRREIEPDAESIGALVDQIWARVPFPARYQQVAERRRVDEMIRALLAWHHASDRTVAAVEASFVLPVGEGAWQARVVGTVDRVDRGPGGALCLVDFKTGRSAATAAAASQHPQLGIYQLAAREGVLMLDDAPDQPGRGGAPAPAGGGDAPAPPGELDDTPAPTAGLGGSGSVGGPNSPAGAAAGSGGSPDAGLGGAELVHLGDRFVSGLPKVRHQAPLGPGHTWVHDVLVDAARLATGPRYPARPSASCSSCAFRIMCPAQGPGRQGPPPLGLSAPEGQA